MTSSNSLPVVTDGALRFNRAQTLISLIGELKIRDVSHLELLNEVAFSEGFVVRRLKGFSLEGVFSPSPDGGLDVTPWGLIPLEDLRNLKAWCATNLNEELRQKAVRKSFFEGSTRHIA